MESVAWALESRKRPVDPRAYLHDELIWLRSGFDRSGRLEYDVCERSGRGIPFPQYIAGATTPGELKAGMPAETRSLVRDLLAGYEEYMEFGGLMDRDGISLLAYGLRDQIRSKPNLRFRSVLVDEVQDLSTLELAVIAEIPTEEENGLYMVGDSVQKVFPKHHSLKDAGLSVTGRAARLNRNYRNTRQILEAAHALIDDFIGDSNIDSSEVVPPEFAVRDGSIPHAYECRDRLQQAQMAATLVVMGTDAWDATCIASDDENSLEEVARLLDGLDIPTQRVSRTEPRREGTLSLAHLDDVKGFEFHTMIVLDVSDPHFKTTADRPETYLGFPSRSVAWEERWRDAFRIYVAMSRAREELHLLYIRNPSILLGCMSEIGDDEESVSRLVEFGSADEWDGEIAEVMRRLTQKNELPATKGPGRIQSVDLDEGRGETAAAGGSRKKVQKGRKAKARSKRQAGGLGKGERKDWSPKQGFGMGWTDANGDTYM
jgi:superfamily I DNA/RNA helicase